MTAQDSDRDFEDLLRLLKETRGFDFTGYKRTTLRRRIQRRMDAVGVATYTDYRDYLEVQPEEYAQLFDNLLIHVTGFFRDAAAWQALQEKVVPELLSAKGPHSPIRVWSAGVATGEEAYTLAMVLAEALGHEEFSRRVKIYATDRDEEALRKGRAATFDERRLEDVPERLREKYFEPGEGRRSFRRDLRRSVIFGRNDLAADAPISRVDLLCARNTLMYFHAETQAEIIRRLHFALSDPGFLFLGRAEMLLNDSSRFEPVDLRMRLFRKVPRRSPAQLGAIPWEQNNREEDEEPPRRLEDASLDAGPVAQLAVDTGGRLRVANARAEVVFNLHQRDIGRPFHDLEVSYRPVELRSLIEQATTELRPVEVSDVTWQPSASGDPVALDLSLTPLHDNAGSLLGVGITFTDVTRYHQLRQELEQANKELESAYEEQQSLNEELETTNEELQSTNEELETTNEELQSTNEELETMNEELQSTNDELQEINEALRVRTDELDRTNTFLESVLRSLGGAVIVLDRSLGVRVWSPGAEDLWGLRPDEAEGQRLLALDIGLPVHDVAPMLREMVAQGDREPASTTVDAVSRRGKRLRLNVSATPRQDPDGEVSGVIIVMDPAEKTT